MAETFNTRDIQAQVLKERFANLCEEYLAVNRQWSQVYDERNRLLLQKQAKDLVEQMQQVEAELKQVLGQQESVNAIPHWEDVVEQAQQSQNSLPSLRDFEFEVVRIENKGLFGFRKEHRHVGTAKYFAEDLGQGISLEMVEIPSGRFTMGAPIEESPTMYEQRPQHRVIISTFFMGKYLITQAQWRAVAALPKINRDLKPDPSKFKGDNRPVESVSWYDAVEFCARLSRKTGREYRLASEAEWEYACRAGTTTRFYFGETITTDLANYDGNCISGDAPKGKYREETTPVGYFPPNAFGLYDMHGNVWEWCADSWHNNYAGAPADGSAWQGLNDEDRVLRGGSWHSHPRNCSSASRLSYFPDNVVSYLNGFRVVCGVAPRT
ncbi:SUMF1/EgtB/PvdO family nonheme iron enzyme [Fischerella sp. JS2]|uniref:SUMF1/EgtB/PvdO family nonheme iron enzyme n=1 Tax=Fischerella sp. JS2 TaxID=2597771 RepID=UPI0028ED2125|nr:SUMF1/EgtB/PvdO family nonheme iron enzyme [Fischerella sp. JS2]